jgi:two-component system sensor histidine kinase KdpD
VSSLPPSFDALARLMTQNIAQALARAHLSGQLEASRLQAETERLRAALLSSVSHDLRSPLSTIIGSAESLKLFGHQLPADDRATLAADIVSEGLRLDRYIQNLLDMTRLGQPGAAMQREWVGVDEICAAAIGRLRKSNPGHRVVLEIGAQPVLLYVNPGLMEQALFNLLENAAKFAPAELPVTVAVVQHGDSVVIDVVDRGPGIPEHARGRVFDMFYSLEHGDRVARGTGLGLAICQGVVAAHGGTIAALPGDGGLGTRMRIVLPFQAAPVEARESA